LSEVLSFVLLACACGAAATTAAPAPAPAPAPPPVVTAQAQPPPESFDDLVALGPTLAPGMREIARKASTDEAIELLHADAGDACVRVAFAAAAPIVAKLVDQGGEVLAAVGPAAHGALGERGPVCVRKGDVVRAMAEGAGRSHVRWVAWEAVLLPPGQ
jgi:hypothetical protein